MRTAVAWLSDCSDTAFRPVASRDPIDLCGQISSRRLLILVLFKSIFIKSIFSEEILF